MLKLYYSLKAVYKIRFGGERAWDGGGVEGVMSEGGSEAEDGGSDRRRQW